MSSILTNTSAMVALQTLKGINSGLEKTQSEISTGKSVATSKDNAATWAIAKVMEADVTGFKKISEGLSVAESTVAVARDASETVTDLLTQMKEKIVQAQDDSQDREKIQADIVALRDQIDTVVKSAQFNGVNLIDGSSTADVEVLSSLNRDSVGTITKGTIDVARKDLSLLSTATAATYGATAVTDTSIIDNGGTAAGTAATVADGATQNIDIASAGDGVGFRIALDDSGGANVLGAPAPFEFVAGAGDSTEDVAENLFTQLNNYLQANGLTSDYEVVRSGDRISLTNNSGGDLQITASSSTGGTAAAPGGLGDVAGIDVTADAADALDKINDLIDVATDAAASFGTVQNQLSTQNDFVGKLMDSMEAGIGSMVDADMEEASAKLQALQTQQQLAIQSLSIANQAPQNILALFQ